MLLCTKCFLIGCRSDAIVDTLFVVCRAVYFFNFRYFKANRHSYLRLLMQSYRIFWILLDSGWLWFAIPAHLRVFVRRHMQTIQNVFVWDLPERICLGAKFWRVCNFRIVLQQSIDNVSSGIFNLISKPNNSLYSMPYTCQIAHATTNLALQAKFVCVNARIIVRNTLCPQRIPNETPQLTPLRKIRVRNCMNFCSLKVTAHHHRR